MRILVTGGAGYIGSHTCLELLKAGHEIVVIDNMVNARPEAVARVQKLAGKSFPFYQADVRDEDRLSKLFDQHAIDCVIHFAGLKAVGESVTIPLRYYDNNLNSTITLCRVMASHEVKRIIFSSSATVYKAGAPMPVDESAPLGCTNPYGWTKFMCEQMLRDLAFADPEWSVVLLRYFNPIGADASGMIGEDPAGIPNNLMPYITQTALGRLKQLSIHGDDYDTPDGTGVRDYIHVSDLARGHLLAVNYVARHLGSEAINLGTGVGYSVLDIVHAFERVIGRRLPAVVGPRRAGDVATVYAKPDKAAQLLGWRAEKDLEDMCRDAWRWQSQNPKGYQEG
ncbi:MAG: UDP-glucose 4-epimerase GalE [Christensenellales bacterium]